MTNNIVDMLLDAIERKLREEVIENAIAKLADQHGMVDVIDGAARVLAYAAYALGQSPKGDMLADHALALHRTAMQLQDDTAQLQRATTQPTSWR